MGHTLRSNLYPSSFVLKVTNSNWPQWSFQNRRKKYHPQLSCEISWKSPLSPKHFHSCLAWSAWKLTASVIFAFESSIIAGTPCHFIIPLISSRHKDITRQRRLQAACSVGTFVRRALLLNRECRKFFRTRHLVRLLARIAKTRGILSRID